MALSTFILRRYGISKHFYITSHFCWHHTWYKQPLFFFRKTRQGKPCNFSVVKQCYFAMESRITPYGSKYHPIPRNECTEIYMIEKFKERQEFNFDDWEEFKLNFLMNDFTITELNFDSITMNALVSYNNVELAQSFLDYLKEIGTEPNLVTCLKFMVVCSKNRNSSTQDHILKMYNRIRSDLDSSLVLDSVTVNCVVQGLCATDKWRKSFDYLKKLPVNNPHHDVKNSLTSAALRDNDETFAWSMILKNYPPGTYPNSDVLAEYIKLASRTRMINPAAGDALFVKFMNYLKIHNIVVKMSVAEVIAEYFKNHKTNWDIKWTKVNESTCGGCNNALAKAHFSDEDFELLRNSFFEKALYKSDAYINTNRKELESFTVFLNYRGPFDYIVDGLNVGYCEAETKIKIKRDMASQLLDVVLKLSKKSKRILILGRWHMKRWPKKTMVQINQKAYTFFTNNFSQDDPFVIHAALFSGPKCLVVSSDLMRDHISRLDTVPLIKMFQQWQQSHQLYVSFDENGSKFQGPIKHSICVQGSMESGWHIPYDNSFILEPYDVLNNWLCIQRTKKQ